MPQKNVRFVATKTVKRPATVKFKTKSGKTEKRLRNLKIQLVDVSAQKDYDFAEFFYHVRQGILRYHSGVGDIIHSVIMKNNGIDQILTFDEKGDFKQIPDLTVLHPKDIKI